MNERAGRRRSLDGGELRLIAGEVVGSLCIVVAVWAVYDGWKALGIFGVALFTICHLIDNRTHPG